MKGSNNCAGGHGDILRVQRRHTDRGIGEEVGRNKRVPTECVEAKGVPIQSAGNWSHLIDAIFTHRLRVFVILTGCAHGAPCSVRDFICGEFDIDGVILI